MNLQSIDKFDISIISDPHVLSYDLIADTEDFKKEIKIDRKLLVESEALLKEAISLSLIHISEPTRRLMASRMPSSA